MGNTLSELQEFFCKETSGHGGGGGTGGLCCKVVFYCHELCSMIFNFWLWSDGIKLLIDDYL